MNTITKALVAIDEAKAARMEKISAKLARLTEHMCPAIIPNTHVYTRVSATVIRRRPLER